MRVKIITLTLLIACLATCSQSEDAEEFEGNPPFYHLDYDDDENDEFDRASTKPFIIQEAITSSPDTKNCTVPTVSNGKIGSRDIIGGQTYFTYFREHEGGTGIGDGSNLFLRCNKKYEPFGTTSREEKIVCNHGEWDRKPFCVPASCRVPPPQVDNAHQLTTNSSHGAKMLYYCIKDFRKSQFEDIRCNFGVWDGTPPVCKDTRCDVNSVAINGVKKELGKRYYKSHESYTPICEEGYSAVRPITRLICINEEWNGRFPQCKPMHSRHEDSREKTTNDTIPVTTTRPLVTTKQPLDPGSTADNGGCSIQNITHGKLMTNITRRTCNIFGFNCRYWNESINVTGNVTFSGGTFLTLTCDPGYTIAGLSRTTLNALCMGGEGWFPRLDSCQRRRWNFPWNRPTAKTRKSNATQAPTTVRSSDHRSSAGMRNRKESSGSTTSKIPVDDANKFVRTPNSIPVTTTSTTTKQPLDPGSSIVQGLCSIQNIPHGKLMRSIERRRCPERLGIYCGRYWDSIEVEINSTFPVGTLLNLTCDPGYTILGSDTSKFTVGCFRGDRWFPRLNACQKTRWRFPNVETRARPPSTTKQPSDHRLSGHLPQLNDSREREWSNIFSATTARTVSKSGRMSEAKDAHKTVSGCPPIQKPAGSQLLIYPEKEYYKFGQLVHFSCPPDHILNSETVRVMCLGGENKWTSEKIPSCVPI